MKVRDGIRLLKDADWEPIRCKGSHQQWLSPDGRVVTVVVNHLNDELSHVVEKALLKAIRGEEGWRKRG